MIYDSRAEEDAREKLRDLCVLPDGDLIFDCLDDCLTVRKLITSLEDGLRRDVKLLDGVYQATRQARLDIAAHESTLLDYLASLCEGSSAEASSLLSFTREILGSAVRAYRIDPAVIKHGLTPKTPSLMAAYLDALVGVALTLPVWTPSRRNETMSGEVQRLRTTGAICEAVLKLNPFTPEELDLDGLREASERIERVLTRPVRDRLHEADAVLFALDPETVAPISASRSASEDVPTTGNDKKTSSRGGRRAGAGRRPYTPEKIRRYSFSLSERQAEAVKMFVDVLRRAERKEPQE